MRAIPVLLLLVVLAVAGCSSKSSTTASSASPSESSPSSPPVTLSGSVNNHGIKDLSASSATTLALEQDNFYFEPTFIKAAPGGRITVTLSNNGKVPHTFTIDALHIDQVVNPDQKKTVTVALPSGGAVNFYCRFHRPLGMQGAFFFEAGASAPAPSAGSSGGGSAPASPAPTTGY